MQIRVVSGLILLTGALLLSPETKASMFEPVSDLQLVCESTDIIHGQVAEVQSAWDNEHTAIWTTASVQVHDVIRGPRQRDAVIKVKEVGGTVGGYTVKAEDFPTFRKGDEVVLLLQSWDDGSDTYRVWGYGRGMFMVTRRETRAPAASRYDVVESGRPTMFVDQLPPAVLLEQLNSQLGALVRRCNAQEHP